MGLLTFNYSVQFENMPKTHNIVKDEENDKSYYVLDTNNGNSMDSMFNTKNEAYLKEESTNPLLYRDSVIKSSTKRELEAKNRIGIVFNIAMMQSIPIEDLETSWIANAADPTELSEEIFHKIYPKDGLGLYNEYVREETNRKFLDRIFEIADDQNVPLTTLDVHWIKDDDSRKFQKEHFVRISEVHGLELYDEYVRRNFELRQDVIPTTVEGCHSAVLKRKPGRPRTTNTAKPKSTKKTGKIWEFVYGLLQDPAHKDIIAWENKREGYFRFLNSDKVAKLWGTMRSEKGTMNFEKFSRAMRYYYRKKIFEAVPEKRLIYRFGKMAPIWHELRINE